MRIRSTKPEFWRSRRIAAVSWDARLVLKGLESYVDDNGVGKDDIALIVSDVFPRDMLANPRETIERVSDCISALADAGLVWRYEDAGTDLIYVSWWESVQRVDKPNKPRFRRPDGTWAYGESQIEGSFATPSRESRDTLAPGTGEQGNRGTGEQGISCASADAERDTAEDDFAAWWSAYPRKRGKGQAAKAYRAALKKVGDPSVLLQAVHEQAGHLMRDGVDYCPYPSTWLSGERWDDDTTPAPAQDQPHRPHAHDLEEPPDGLSDDEYADWWAAQRARRSS